MNDELEKLLSLETELQLTRFDSTAAWKLGNWLVDKARRESLKIAVGISRGGQRLFHWAADGTCPDNDSWIDRKTRTVYRWGHSTYFMGRKLELENTTGAVKYSVSDQEYCFHGGAFPVIVKGVGPVGVVTVSGLKQHVDHELAVEALRSLIRKPTAKKRPSA